MKIDCDNSFFHQDYKNLNVLLFVPHQDDETIAAASLLYNLSHCGAHITLVYTTNGDYTYPAEIRFKEAINAAAILGISKSNIYFMGYGDNYNNNNHSHLFYYNDEVATSLTGHTETYGTDNYPDYAFLHEKRHHSYTSKNYLTDLLSIIRKTRADLIIATDFDYHADHRMLSLYLDRAIGILKKEKPSYKPEIWKRFTYSLAYKAVADYSSVNNPETKLPVAGGNNRYQDIIGTLFFNWSSRVRIPVPKKAQSCPIRNNVLCKALEQHKSQRLITKARRILSSDEVFWARSTDSISYEAEVTVSSGIGKYLTDFMVYNVNDIDQLTPEYSDYYWQPEYDDPEKTAELKWKKPVVIEKIVLYPAISVTGKINALQITLNNGLKKVIRNLSQNGAPTEIILERQENITSCTLKILSVSGDTYGISEWEIYSSAEYTSKIHPFCKILINDNFVYQYIIPKNVKTLPIDVYTYGDTGNVSLSVEKGKSTIREGKVLIDESDQNIIIKAENQSGYVYDLIIIKRVSKTSLKLKMLSDMADSIFLKLKAKELNYFHKCNRVVRK